VTTGASDAKERIRAALDIADIIGDSVALKSAGKERLKGLCPFHQEKTPSFHVHAGRGFYYCFGCGAKGDVFDFVMQSQGVDFADALQILGRRAGIDVTPNPAAAASGQRRKDLFAVNDFALRHFIGRLAEEARHYLLERGLTDESIDQWGLGWAPDAWDDLLKAALQQGVSEDDLLAAGLLSENERGRRYDRFRGRIMFPIRDRLGRTVGFSGRVLGDAVPKYVNTPETDVFDKGSVLYGLDQARAAIREQGTALVVEGYMDVIALHQTGFNHAVAALGATLTEAQAQELQRLDVDRVLLAFDADDAGQRAVLSGLDQSIGRDFRVEAVTIPDGKDPADAVLGGFIDRFKDALESGQSAIAFRLEAALQKHDANTSAGRRAILDELAPSMEMRGPHDDVAAEMRRLVISALALDEQQLASWLRSRKRTSLTDVQLKGMERGVNLDDEVLQVEVDLMALMLTQTGRLEGLVARVEPEVPAELADSALRAFAGVAREEGFDVGRILGRYRERPEGRVLFPRVLEHEDDESVAPAQLERHLQIGLSRLRERVLDREARQPRQELTRRLDELKARLRDETLQEAELRACYDELAEVHALLAARDAERRSRLPARAKRAGGKKRSS
jgi:DNA primase